MCVVQEQRKVSPAAASQTVETIPKAANGILILNCAGLSSADSASCPCVVLVVGVHIAHPHHWRSTAGHSD